MSFHNSKKSFVFKWCGTHTLESVSNPELIQASKHTRLCYITTEIYRIYLVAGYGSLAYWPFQLVEGVWVKLHNHMWVVADVEDQHLHTEDTLWEAMCFQIVKQFRSSVESYYADAPKGREVLMRLHPGDSVDALERLRYTWHYIDVQEDKEWAGAVAVVCSDGELLLPYKLTNDKELLLEYATFYPDKPLQGLTSCVSGCIEKISSIVRNLHWSNIRLYIEFKGLNKHEKDKETDTSRC